MKRNLLVILFFTCNSFLFSQSELQIALKNKDFKEVKRISENHLKTNSNSFVGNFSLGKAYMGTNEIEKAIPYLLKALDNATENWQFAWTNTDLVEAYFSIGNYVKAREYYTYANQIKGTKNSKKQLKQLGLLFGFDVIYNDWETVEKEYIRFHFQDKSSIKNIKDFINKRENAVKKINSFFNSKFPKKIDFFVWKSNDKAMKILKINLGFAKPNYSIAHNRKNQSIGHELAHNISFWASKKRIKNRFINEGIEVYFDQSKVNRIIIAKQIVFSEKIDIKKIWQFPNSYSENKLYPIAGAFVEYLFNFDKGKLFELNKNQTYENAVEIYGNELHKLIVDFEKKLNN